MKRFVAILRYILLRIKLRRTLRTSGLGINNFKLNLRCISVLLCFLCFFSFIGCEQQNAYGSIIEDKTKERDGITVEHVMLYPQMHHDSSDKITRRADLARCNNANATLLICHGLMCD